MAFKFYGTPEAINAAAQAHSATANATAAAQTAAYGAEGQRAQAQGQVLQGLYQQPGQFAAALGQMGAGQSQAAGMIGAGYGNLGQAYGAIGQAMSNERSNLYGANAAAESARQAGMANLGTGAMAAYGGAANQALQSQAMQSTAYYKALSDMMAANQGAVSGMGRAQVVAGAMPSLGGSGGFSAYGVDGPIASGSYGGVNYAGSKPDGGQALSALSSGDQAYRDQLERGFTSQAGVPREMLGDVYGGVRDLYDSSSGGLSRGMDQYYAVQNDPRNRSDYSGPLAGLGYIGSQMGNLATQASNKSGYSALQNLWNRSLGNIGAFKGTKKDSFWDWF